MTPNPYVSALTFYESYWKSLCANCVNQCWRTLAILIVSQDKLFDWIYLYASKIRQFEFSVESRLDLSHGGSVRPFDAEATMHVILWSSLHRRLHNLAVAHGFINIAAGCVRSSAGTRVAGGRFHPDDFDSICGRAGRPWFPNLCVSPASTRGGREHGVLCICRICWRIFSFELMVPAAAGDGGSSRKQPPLNPLQFFAAVCVCVCMLSSIFLVAGESLSMFALEIWIWLRECSLGRFSTQMLFSAASWNTVCSMLFVLCIHSFTLRENTHSPSRQPFSLQYVI